MSESIFTKIIRGEIPAHKIYEDESFLAFLDIRPINPGHTLVVPKQQIDYLFDLPNDVYTGLMAVCKKIEPAIRKASGAKRVGIAVEGFAIPHAHIHLVPINSGNELDSNRAKPASDETLAAMAEKIKSFLYAK